MPPVSSDEAATHETINKDMTKAINLGVIIMETSSTIRLPKAANFEKFMA